MPELPEVETTRRASSPWLVGRRIEASRYASGGCAGACRAASREARGKHPRGRPARQVPAHRHRGRHAHLASRDVGSLRILDAAAPARARSRGSRARFGTMPAVQRPAPLRLPPVHDRRSRTPQAARGPAVEPLSDEFSGGCALEPRARGRRASSGPSSWIRASSPASATSMRARRSFARASGRALQPGASAALMWRRSSNQFARC